MAQKTIAEVLLKFSLDNSKLKQAYDQLERVKKNIAAIGGETEKVNAILDAFSATQAGLERTAAIGNLVKEYKSLETQLGGAEATAKQLRDMLKEIGATDDEIKSAVDQFERLSSMQTKAGAAKGGRGGNLASSAQQLGSTLGLTGVSGASNLINDIQGVAQSLGGLGISVGALAGAAVLASPALIAAGISISNFIKQIDAQKKQIDSAVKGLEAYYDALESGTTESINNSIKELEKKREFDQRELAQIQSIIANARNQSALVELLGGLDSLKKREEELTASVNDAETSLLSYNNALGTAEVAANDAAAAQEAAAQSMLDYERQLAEARQKAVDEAVNTTIDAANREIDYRRKLRELSELDADTLAERAKELQQAIDDQKAYIAILETSSASNENYTQTMLDAQNDLNDLEGLLDAATGTLKDNAEAEAKRLQVIQSVTDAIQSGINSIKNIGDAISEANKKTADVERKFGEDRAEAEIRANEKRADAAGKYNDKLIEIAEQAANAADKALQKLNDKRSDLQRDFGNEETEQSRKDADSRLEAQIDAQREEAKAYRDHLQKLKEIRERSQISEAEAIQRGDFGELFNIRRRTASDLNNENDSFKRERDERQRQLEDRLADIDREGQIERRERAIQFQQRLDEARVAYQRELAEAAAARAVALVKAQEARSKELAEIDKDLQRTLDARRRSADRELELIRQTRDERIRAEIEVQKAHIRGAAGVANTITSIFNQLIGGFGGKTPRKMAAGGNLAGGMSAVVNEPGSSGREFARKGNNVLYFPGMGVFTPSGNTTIDPNRGGANNITLQQYNTFTSANPNEIMPMIDQRTGELLRQAKVKIGA